MGTHRWLGIAGLGLCLLVLLVAVSGCGVPAQALTASAPEPIMAPTALPIRQDVPQRPIYILDPSDQSMLSRILVVDPDRGRVAFEIPTRFLPEAVLSPDGTRLFVADTFHDRVVRGAQHDVISVFDARTGGLLLDDVEVSGRLLYKGLPYGDPFMHLSDDGRLLYVRRYGDPDPHRLRLAILDATTLTTVYDGLLPRCERLAYAPDDRWLCINQGALELVNPRGVDASRQLVRLASPDIVAIARVPDGDQLYLVSARRQVQVVDTSTRTATDARQLDLHAGWKVTHEAALSSGGDRLYVGVDLGDDENSDFTDGVAVYDTATWRRITTIKTGRWLSYFALSAAGDRLYAVDTEARTLAIYDTATFEQVRLLPDLGDQPTRVLAAH